jgi:sugar phosphate isomerase/epimerase
MWTRADIRVPIPFDGMEEVLDEAARRGLGAEFQGMYDPKRLDEGFERALSRASAAFRGFPFAVALHAPFLDLNPVSPDPGVAALSRRRYEQAFETSRAIRASRIVFHSQFGAMNRDPKYPETWLARSREYWASRETRLASAGCTAAIENIFESDPGPICRLLDALASDRFGACLDVGHAHLFRGDAPAFARGFGARITHVHLHDNDGAWDYHRRVGAGTAAVAPTLQILAALSPAPTLTLEMPLREDIAESLQWLAEAGFLNPGI